MRILFILLLASIGAKAQDTRIDWRYHNSGFAGEFYTKNLGKVADTSTYKIIGINPTTGKHVYMNWLYAGSGGGSTSPAGNFGNIQLARNGAFAAAGSDSLSFLAGLAIKGTLSATTDMQISGISGFGMAPSSGVRAYFQGSGTSSSTYSAAFRNSSSQNVVLVRDDHALQLFGNMDIDATPTSSNPLGIPLNVKSANNTSTTYAYGFKNSDNAYIGTLANNGDLSILNRIIAGTTTPTTPTSTLDIRGSFSSPYAAKTANYTLTASDFTVEATANSFTLTLPTAVGCQGRVYILKNSGGGYVTVATTSSQTIDGNSTATIPPKEPLYVQSDGSGWAVLSNSQAGNFFNQSTGNIDVTLTFAKTFVALTGLTANHTVTLPAASVWPGQEIIIWNQNTSGTFSYSFATTVVDAAGSTITTLTNSAFYRLYSTGTSIVKTN